MTADHTARDVGPPGGRAAPPAAATRPRSLWRRRISATLRIIRANPTGRWALKVAVGILGAFFVALGIVLIPLPGPGWLIVLFGLTIWAVEFVWAKRLLQYTRTRVQRWTRWVAARSWPVRLALGTVGLVFVGAVVALSLMYGIGLDSLARFWHFITSN